MCFLEVKQIGGPCEEEANGFACSTGYFCRLLAQLKLMRQIFSTLHIDF